MSVLLGKAVRNRSRVEQSAFVDDKRITVSPHETKILKEDEAAAIVRRCTPHVIYAEGLNTIVDEGYGGERIWLFNRTGNPDAKEEELRAPKVLVRKMGGGETLVVHKKEQTSQRAPQTLHYLHPWTRKSFPKAKGEWFLQRAHLARARMRDQYGGVKIQAMEVGRARGIGEPQANGIIPVEPDDDWSLFDMQVYANIVDPGIQIPLSEKRIIEAYKNNNWELLGEKLEIEDASSRGLEQLIDDERRTLFRRLFFRIVDPAFTLPDQAEFDMRKAAMIKGQTKKGRPPASQGQQVSA